MQDRALALTSGHYDSVFAKTTHGLVRGPSRYDLVGVIDGAYAGRDAGEALDGAWRDIPFFASVPDALARLEQPPTHCVVGVATVGGVLPRDLYADLEDAARAGLTLVNGLHALLSQDPHLARLASEYGGGIVDIRKPKPASALRFWSGDILSVAAPRVAVLGMDCAIGKRTTCMMLRESCRRRGVRAEMIYTGQTGWLQGLRHGFIFDATINDFVSGELEGAILSCVREAKPDLILLEGQSALRNPSGPAGAELLLSGAARGVILQHAPDRRFFEDFEGLGCAIPALSEEIALIRMLGASVWAVTLYARGLVPARAHRVRADLEASLGLPVMLPLEQGVEAVTDAILRHTGLEGAS